MSRPTRKTLLKFFACSFLSGLFSDFPGVLSGDVLAFIDPFEKYFINNEDQKSSCNMWLLTDDVDNAELQKCRQQIQPFCQDLFDVPSDILEKGFYNGTLFRFPLRHTTHHMGNPWVLCTPDKIMTELFETLGTEATSVLLFLNHVERIEMYVKCKEDYSAKLILKISISPQSLSLVQERRKEFQGSLDFRNFTILNFPMTEEVTHCDAHTDAIQTKKYSWVISLCHIGKDEQENVAEIISSLKVLPVGGVALPLYVYNESGDLKFPENDQRNGQVFSFLRLPLADRNPTGLHTHLHGYFVLDQSRRNLKWPSATHDLSSVTDAAQRWNIFLKRVLLPQTMVSLAEFLTTGQYVVDNETSQMMTRVTGMNYREFFLSMLIPNPVHVTPQWKVLEELFYQKISHKAVFFHPHEADVHIGSWVKAFEEKVIFDNTGHDKSEVAVRRKVLSFRGKLLVVQSREILTALEQYNQRKVAVVSPSVVCDCMKTGHAEYALSEAEKRKALKFVINANATDLINVPLMPLHNGEWTFFGRKVFLLPANNTETAILMPFSELRKNFIRDDLEPDVITSLQKMQQQGKVI